jgi:hypothetical protein
MKQISYALVVWSLIYAQVCICPDIVFVVGMLTGIKQIRKWTIGKLIRKFCAIYKGLKTIWLILESQITLMLLVILILTFLVALIAKNPHQVTYSCLQEDQFHGIVLSSL